VGLLGPEGRGIPLFNVLLTKADVIYDLNTSIAFNLCAYSSELECYPYRVACVMKTGIVGWEDLFQSIGTNHCACVAKS
jgi:hypothetical protein